MKHAARFFVVIALLLPSVTSARDDFEDRGCWYPFVEHFAWREIDGGNQVAREVGEAIGIGASGEYLLAEDTKLILRLQGEAGYGRGDFDRAVSSTAKVSSTSSRISARGETDLAWWLRIREAQAELLPYVGIGYRWWKADVKNASGLPAFGKSWNSFYARLGARGAYKCGRRLFADLDAGVKVPVYTTVSSGQSGESFRPGTEVSLYAEAGLSYEGIRPALYYEGFRYAASGNGVAFPRTEGDVFGLKVAFQF